MSPRIRGLLGPPGPWIGALLVLLALEVAVALCSEDAVREALAGRSHAALRAWVAGQHGRDPAVLRAELAGDLRSLELLGAALFVLYHVVRLHLAVWRRPRLLPLSILAWWLAVEQLVAPRLTSLDWTQHLLLVRGVDHRPTEVGGRYNSDSVIATEESAAFVPRDLNVVFLGDSFAAGYRLAPDEEPFPALVGDAIARAHPDRRVHVANFGWLSSSPVLSWRRLVDLGDRYAPDLVVMAVDMTDFADDVRYERVIEQRGIYWLYDKIPLTLRILSGIAPQTYRRVAAWSVGGVPPRRFFATEAPLAETRPWMMTLARNCDRIAAWCRERGARFAVVVLPRSYQYSAREVPRNPEASEYVVLGPHCLEPFRFFDELRPTAGYPIVSLLEDFRANTEFPTCFEDDAHWNALGHRIAARAIARELAPLVDEIVRAGG
jgi:hypothetical protein